MSVNLSDYVGGKSTVSQTAGVRGTDVSGSSNRNVPELNLKAGEQLRGTVIEADAGKVTIETKDHGVFMARLENGMQVNKGDVLDFEVRGMQGRQITLTPLYSNMSVDSSAVKALQAAALPVTDAHVRMVNEMMSQGMGIDRQSLHGMAGLVGQYQTASPELLVQMKQLGIPISNDSVMQMESYRNNTAQIVNGFGEVGEQIHGLMREMAANGEYEALGRLFTEAAKLFAEGELAEGLTGRVPDGAAGQTADGMQDGVVRLVTDGSVNGETGMQADKEAAPGTENSIHTPAADSMQDGVVRLVSDGGIPKETGIQPDGTAAAEAESGAQRTVDNPKEGMSRLMADGSMVGNGGTRPDGVNGTETGEYTQKTAAESPNRDGSSVSDSSVSGEGGVRTDGQQDLFSAFMKSLSDAYAKQGQNPQFYRGVGQELARLLEESQFRTSFQNAMVKKWLLTPQETASKEQVQELYETVLRQTGQLKQLLADAGRQDSPAMKSLQNMERDVEFLNELNQNFAYVQLPLKMSGQHANGDLYVYTNKKGFAGRDGAVTAFLHLGMDHLGDMDIYVALQNQKVSTKFYLEDDSVIDFLEAHMDELDKRLAGKGYVMKAELLRKDHEDSGNVFDQMLKDSKNAGAAPPILLSRQSFDARA
ncbi:MAG: flagellar hook-length control protein FliK [Lachnospiraceae bacterium]|nr:flagellar hook-length control protein FliK [Lachnospiraceae bacterium]